MDVSISNGFASRETCAEVDRLNKRHVFSRVALYSLLCSMSNMHRLNNTA